MKKKVCIIGAFPPPINGNSKALSTLVESKLFNSTFDYCIIDLAKIYHGKTGKLSIEKIIGVFRLNKQIRRVAKTGNVDVFYLSISQNTVGAIRDIIILRQIYKHEKNAKVLLHLHGGGFKQFYKNANVFIKMIIKTYFSKASKAIVLGETLIDMFDDILPKEKIAIVPNCVDDAYFVKIDDFRKKIDNISKKKSYSILYLSNMIETKGYKDVLEAAVNLCKVDGRINFLFAGKFNNEKDQIEFERIVKENTLGQNIQYLGVVGGAEKLEILKSSDIFVLPTYYPNEGQPISILEAMASGMPIITTNHAGIKDVVKDNRNGIIVPVKDPEAIVFAIRKLLCSTDMMQRIAGQNRKVVLEKYCEDRYVRDLIEIFGGVLNNKEENIAM